MLLAGVGRTILTPPLGTPLVGYGGRERGTDSIRDDIYATSLVLSGRRNDGCPRHLRSLRAANPAGTVRATAD